MKKILFHVFMLASVVMFGQNKINFRLAHLLSEQPQSVLPIDLFVKGNAETVKQLCLSNNGDLKYSSGDISVIRIPVSAIKHFISSPGISRIEAYTPHTQPMNDTMLIQTNTVQVHAGQSPLPQGYDGTGVVIGIIDTGIDFTHPDFLDSTGKSRISYLWDQKLSTAANTPSPYNYGQEWTGIQIDSGLAAAHNDLDYAGHGTHVAGIAVGNGLATGNYKGVAPKADIVFVALDLNSNSSTLITDAVNYIYSKAQALGKPCVINASLGDYLGSHDGQDLQAQMISNMIVAQAGRSLVAAAGNGGNVPFHLGYNVNADTSFTFFNYTGQPIYIQMWADSADFSNVDFSIGADQLSPYSYRGNIPFSNISSHLGIVGSDTLYNAGNRIGRILSYGDLINGTYSMEFLIYPDSASYNWRLITTGAGKFDTWSFDMFNGSLPNSALMGDSVFYKFPDTDKTIVSSFQCLDNVITVANYTNRKTYIDYNNNLFVNTASNPGERHITSSIGPTRDGRIKPDIAAPGDNTVAAVVLSIAPDIIANYPDALAQGGFHVRNGGTSHSSPCVAGVAALFLQKNPLATAMDIKNAIINCPLTDTFTGSSLPDNYWGYGKINAFGALTCSLTGLESNEAESSGLVVYPNPSCSGETVNFELKDNLYQGSKIMIFDVLGKLVESISLSGNKTSFTVNLKPGVYFCNLNKNNRFISSEKLVIL